MGEEAFKEVYEKFKLNFYKNIFAGFSQRESSLTATETFSLEVIYALDGPTVNEVAEFLDLSQPNMTYKINNLVKKGYVRKLPSKEDRREVILEVTEKFQHYYEIKNRYIDLVLQRTRDRLSQEDYEKFQEILSIMSKELMTEVTEKLGNIKV